MHDYNERRHLDKPGITMSAEKKEQKFKLEADPFNTGFEVRENITTNEVVQFVADRRSFMPKDEPFSDPAWWKANAKAAIKGNWFTAPDWNVNDVHGWPIAKTRWLSLWVNAFYEEMIHVPFGS